VRRLNPRGGAVSDGAADAGTEFDGSTHEAPIDFGQASQELPGKLPDGVSAGQVDQMNGHGGGSPGAAESRAAPPVLVVGTAQFGPAFRQFLSGGFEGTGIAEAIGARTAR